MQSPLTQPAETNELSIKDAIDWLAAVIEYARNKTVVQFSQTTTETTPLLSASGATLFPAPSLEIPKYQSFFLMIKELQDVSNLDKDSYLFIFSTKYLANLNDFNAAILKSFDSFSEVQLTHKNGGVEELGLKVSKTSYCKLPLHSKSWEVIRDKYFQTLAQAIMRTFDLRRQLKSSCLCSRKSLSLELDDLNVIISEMLHINKPREVPYKTKNWWQRFIEADGLPIQVVRQGINRLIASLENAPYFFRSENFILSGVKNTQNLLMRLNSGGHGAVAAIINNIEDLNTKIKGLPTNDIRQDDPPSNANEFSL